LAISSVDADAVKANRPAPGSGLVDPSAMGPNRANFQPVLNDSRDRVGESSAKVLGIQKSPHANTTAARTRFMLRLLNVNGKLANPDSKLWNSPVATWKSNRRHLPGVRPQSNSTMAEGVFLPWRS
jgi:hypothetical protein